MAKVRLHKRVAENKVRSADLAQILYGLLHCAKEFREDLGLIQMMGSHLKFLAGKPHDKTHALEK